MSKEIDEIMDPIDIRYKGLIDFGALYSTIRQWFDRNRYDFMETKYKDKIETVFGNEVEIDMSPELKLTEYVKFHIEVHMHMHEYKEFETVIDGEKKMMGNARILIRLSCKVELDYSNKYDDGWKKKVHDTLVDNVFDRYMDYKYYDLLAQQVYDLQSEIKKFLKMST